MPEREPSPAHRGFEEREQLAMGSRQLEARPHELMELSPVALMELSPHGLMEVSPHGLTRGGQAPQLDQGKSSSTA